MIGQFKSAAKPARVVTQQLERKGDRAGFITAMTYVDAAQLQATYAADVDGMGKDVKPAEGVGEQSAASGSAAAFAEVAFIRCGALVHARFVGGVDVSSATAYAKRLDQRLRTALCP